MTREAILKSLRDAGYDGPGELEAVKSWVTDQGATLVDEADEPIDLDTAFAAKGITITVAKNANEPDTVEVTEGSGGEQQAEPPPPGESAEMKSLKSRLATLEAKTGIKESGVNRASKSATDRWNFRTVRPEVAAYKARIKRSRELPLDERPVFDDVDKAEYAGAQFRYHASLVTGKHYSQKTRDREIIGKGATLGNANQGGSFSPGDEFLPELIDLQLNYGTARRLVPFRPIPKEGISYPRWDADLTMTWNTEGATLSDQNPDTSRVSLYPKKLTGYMKISNDLLMADAVGMVDQAYRSFARTAANKEDNAFFLGDGTSTYGGIVGIENAIGSAGVVAQATGSTWAAIVDADVQQWFGKLSHIAWQMGRPRFTCTSAAFFEIINRLNSTKGGITYRESASGQVIWQYNGFDFEWNNVMASATATSTHSIYFGAFELGIKCGQAGTLEFAQSDQRHFDTDEIALRVIEHVDINCHDLGDSSTPGVVVCLATDAS